MILQMELGEATADEPPAPSSVLSVERASVSGQLFDGDDNWQLRSTSAVRLKAFTGRSI